MAAVMSFLGRKAAFAAYRQYVARSAIHFDRASSSAIRRPSFFSTAEEVHQ